MAEQRRPQATAGGFSARLVATDGTSYELSGEQTLGRSADADITISHPKISRVHARFRVSGQQLTVEDLKSANGTRVNQRRIEGTAVLGDGDVVSFDTVDLSIVLTGLTQDDEATVVSRDDEATVVASITAVAPEPAPAPAPKMPPAEVQAEAPAAPEPPAPWNPAPEVQVSSAPQAKASAPDVPGSWIDQSDGEHTQVLRAGDVAARTGAELAVESASDLPHLVIIMKSGARQVVELEPAGEDKADVWEIGSAEDCQIVVAEVGVSRRHAQLVHKSGRWQVVKLPAQNGIFVNGEKRLTAYLTDGDEIGLGMAALVFKAGRGAVARPTARGADQRSGARAESDGKRFKLLALGLGVVVVALGVWWFLR